MPHQGETSSGNQDALPWCGEEQEQAGLVKGGNRELGKKVKRDQLYSPETHTRVSLTLPPPKERR